MKGDSSRGGRGEGRPGGDGRKGKERRDGKGSKERQIHGRGKGNVFT